MLKERTLRDFKHELQVVSWRVSYDVKFLTEAAKPFHTTLCEIKVD